MPYAPDNFYEYTGTGMYVCGRCLQRDLDATKRGELVDDERVYPGMFTRLPDDAYMCDSCGEMNEAYESLGEEE